MQNRCIDLTFLLPADGSLCMSDEEVGAVLAKACIKAGELVREVIPDSQAADNLEEYEPGYSKGSYLDDMVTLAGEAREANVTILWPSGIEPDYE